MSDGVTPGAAEKAAALLSVQQLGVRFGGVAALQDISFTVEAGESVAVIGSNGSGKTTLFNLLSGRIRPTEGRADFAGHEITRKASDRIARMGVARTFQEVRIYRRFTVLENMLFALRQRRGETVAAALFPFGGARRRAPMIQTAEMWLECVGLADRRDALAGQLSYGRGKLLEIVRALCTQPRLVLLDEPAAGLSPAGLQDLYGLLKGERCAGITVLFVEHNLNAVEQLADRVLALHAGRLIAVGTPGDIQQNALVRAAYAGNQEQRSC